MTPPSCGSSAFASAKCGQLRCWVPTWTIAVGQRAHDLHRLGGRRQRRGVRGRLLEVDILARRDRIDRQLGMPVIRRGDQDRIDVLTVEDAAIVFVAVDLRAVAGQSAGRWSRAAP